MTATLKPSARKPATPVAQMRERIIAFLATQQEPIDTGPIREHLGLDQYAWLPLLNQALTSRRINVTRAHPAIAYKEGKPVLWAATPIKLYSLAASR